MASRDEDLPADEHFRPTEPQAEVILSTPGGPTIAMAMTLPAQAQAAIHHNRARYAELHALRLGQPNRYHATRYRH